MNIEIKPEYIQNLKDRGYDMEGEDSFIKAFFEQLIEVVLGIKGTTAVYYKDFVICTKKHYSEDTDVGASILNESNATKYARMLEKYKELAKDMFGLDEKK
jgi:hypothetical protein